MNRSLLTHKKGRRAFLTLVGGLCLMFLGPPAMLAVQDYSGHLANLLGTGMGSVGGSVALFGMYLCMKAEEEMLSAYITTHRGMLAQPR
jgi:hypothetical protein